MPATQDPLTVVVARRIRPGREDDFERAMREFVSWSLTRPGHEGLHVLRPGTRSGDAPSEYTVVARFRDPEARREYTQSPEYATWMARLGELTVGGARIHELSGLEGFVTLPGSVLRRPPSWKLAIATFCGVYPTVLVFSRGLGPSLAGLHWLAAAAIVNAAVVASLTWIVMPAVTRALRGWLFPLDAREDTR